MENKGVKSRLIKTLDIFVEAINYILISYAISNMALFFYSSVLYVLFLASEIWVFSNFWRSLRSKIKSGVLSAGIVIGCFLIHIGMVYFIGRVSGTLIPFR